MGTQGPWQVLGRRTTERGASRGSFARGAAALLHLVTVEETPIKLQQGNGNLWVTLQSPQCFLHSAFSRFELEFLEEFIFCG